MLTLDRYVSGHLLPRGLQLGGFVILGVCAVYTVCLIVAVSPLETTAVVLRLLIYGE